MSSLIYCTVFGFMAFSVISHVGALNAKELKKCFEDNDTISIAASATASCFKDVIDVQITKITENKTCTIFEDFTEKYTTFLKAGVDLCVNSTSTFKFGSQRSKLFDIFKFAVIDDSLKNFAADNGIECIKKTAKGINNCVQSQRSVLPAVNTTWQWARRTSLLFDGTSCIRTSKVKDCVVEVLKGNCSESNMNYVTGLFDFVLYQDHLCNNASNSKPELPPIMDTKQSFPPWAIILILLGSLMLIAIIILIIVKMKSTKYDFLLSFHKEK